MTTVKDRIVESQNLWAGLGALFIGAGFVGFLSYNGIESQSTLMWMGFLGLYITQVLGKKKSMQEGAKFQAKMEKALNGDMDDKIRTIIRQELNRSQNDNEVKESPETS